jgi:hypothetical protein
MKRALSVMVLLIPFYLSGYANGNDLKSVQEDIDKLKKGQALIVKELQEIKKLLQTRAPKRVPFKEAVFDIGDDPFMGDKNAVLTMVDFSDYE